MDGRSQKPGTRRSRWAWAVRGVTGLTVASAVSAATAADGPRAAVLLPPRVGEPLAAPLVARGAIDDDPLASTPVVRKGAPRPLVPPAGAKAAQDWLSGVDPNVTPAGALAAAKSPSPSKGVTPAKLTLDARPPVSVLPPAGSPKLTPPPSLFAPGEPNPMTKSVPPFKAFPTPEGSAAMAPAGSPQPDPRSPRDALQGTAANGAPVLAGPPAWRWYGYGSVTPGANAYAPGGQYPRASANWYSVTKATPGAFPVPVVNPFRGGPGAEPPSYASVTPAPPRPTFTPMPADTSALPPPRMNPITAPVPFAAAPMPLPVPTMPPLSAPMPVSVAPPVFSPVPLPPPPAIRAPEPLATAEPPTARPTPPPILPPLSVIPMPAPPALPTMPLPALPSLVPAGPSVAPVSAPAAADDDVRWKSNPTTRPAPPPAGTWVRPPVARGQIGDEVQEPADPVGTIVEAVCRGRATGVDVRHTGPLQVTVCFETRTPTDATALVRDLSARPELARYEVNFCVLVK